MSDMRTTATAMIEAELRDDLAKITDLEEALRFAFKKVQRHWMFTDQNDQFAAAVGAVGLRFGLDSPEFERLRKASEAQKRAAAIMNALQAGIPMDLESLASQAESEGPVIPLNRLWWDAVEAADKARAAP